MIKELLGSKVKAAIIFYLALRGGTSGRRLARALKISPTQVFKALRPMVAQGWILANPQFRYYALNPRHLFYEDFRNMIHKEVTQHPSLPAERKIDPLAVYQILSLRGTSPHSEKISDRLRDLYG